MDGEGFEPRTSRKGAKNAKETLRSRSPFRTLRANSRLSRFVYFALFRVIRVPKFFRPFRVPMFFARNCPMPTPLPSRKGYDFDEAWFQAWVKDNPPPAGMIAAPFVSDV